MRSVAPRRWAAVLALVVDRVLAMLEYAATPRYLRRTTR